VAIGYLSELGRINSASKACKRSVGLYMDSEVHIPTVFIGRIVMMVIYFEIKKVQRY
jgi:hypothetical protein